MIIYPIAAFSLIVIAALLAALIYLWRAHDTYVNGLLEIVSRMQNENVDLTQTALRAHNIPFISSKRETIPSEGWWDRKPRTRPVKLAGSDEDEKTNAS